jgi:tetratricopeptide (TPR) repeat protein
MTTHYFKFAHVAIIAGIMVTTCKTSAYAQGAAPQKFFGQAEDESPAEKYVARGYAAGKNNFHEQAIEYYQKTIEIDPNDTTAYYQIMMSLTDILTILSTVIYIAIVMILSIVIGDWGLKFQKKLNLPHFKLLKTKIMKLRMLLLILFVSLGCSAETPKTRPDKVVTEQLELFKSADPEDLSHEELVHLAVLHEKQIEILRKIVVQNQYAIRALTEAMLSDNWPHDAKKALTQWYVDYDSEFKQYVHWSYDPTDWLSERVNWHLTKTADGTGRWSSLQIYHPKKVLMTNWLSMTIPYDTDYRPNF